MSRRHLISVDPDSDLDLVEVEMRRKLEQKIVWMRGTLWRGRRWKGSVERGIERNGNVLGRLSLLFERISRSDLCFVP